MWLWMVSSVKEHIFHVGEVFLNIKKKKNLAKLYDNGKHACTLV